MKTVIYEYKEPAPYHDKIDFIIHHGADISVSRQIRPLHAKMRMYSGGDPEPLRELEFVVVRFPKSLKAELSTDFYMNLKRVFYHQWEDAGEDTELLLHEGNMGRALEGLAEAGVFRLDTKVYPDFSNGLYLPHYRNPTRLWQRGLNFVTITLSIPQGIGMLIKEESQKRKQAKTDKERV